MGLIPGRSRVGEVHDENAWAAGGVAGHAGLFGTGRKVFALAACLCGPIREKKSGRSPRRWSSSSSLSLPALTGLTASTPPGRDPAQRAAGRYFSPNSVGHLGFTGTSFWLDLDSGQMVVLLTNRVHLGRDDKTKIAGLPPWLPRGHVPGFGVWSILRVKTTPIRVNANIFSLRHPIKNLNPPYLPFFKEGN